MNSFPLRSAETHPRSLSSLAELLGLPVLESDLQIRGVAPISTAGPDQLGFVARKRYVAEIASSRAGALLVGSKAASAIQDPDRPVLLVDDPHAALVILLNLFHPPLDVSPEIHPTAVFGRGARIGADVRIGPYAVVEEGATIGDRTMIGAHAVVGSHARIGEDCILHPHVVIYPDAELGDRVILHAGVRIGVDGFGWVELDGVPTKIPQVGPCKLDSDVEIGANSTIDRGSIAATHIGPFCKFDNLVQVAHNSSIGAGSLLAALTGVAGSSVLEEGVRAGGQAGIAGHLTVGKGAQLAAKTGVISDVAAGEVVMGFPARPRAEFLKSMASVRRLPALLERITEMERRIAELEGDE